jgi:bifunctional DNase/RNase
MEMFVAGITIDGLSPILVLTDSRRRRALPIRIGPLEMDSICTAVVDQRPERPLSHDLTLNIIENLGWKLKCVEVNELSCNTIFASMILEPRDGSNGDPTKERAIDSRPSDAIAVALRANAPIYVAPQVVADGAIAVDQELDDYEREQFHGFVSDVKPSDFEKLYKDDLQKGTWNPDIDAA